MNGYVSTFAELLVNLNKVWQQFVKELVADNNAPSAIIKSSVLTLVTTNDTESCSTSESENLVSLITNTTNAVEQCFSNLSSDSSIFVNDFYNIFESASELITNTTSNVTRCVETNSNNILNLPLCILQQLQYVNNDLVVIASEINKILPNAIRNAGVFAKTVSSCITNTINEFLSSIYYILIDFLDCIEQ